MLCVERATVLSLRKVTAAHAKEYNFCLDFSLPPMCSYMECWGTRLVRHKMMKSI